MPISKESKEIIREHIKSLREKRKEILSNIEEVKREEDNIKNRKIQMQEQLSELDAMVDKINIDIA